MKLVGKLKEKVEKAESKEEANKLIREAGMELTDEEIDGVSGGWGMVRTSPVLDDTPKSYV